MVSEIFGSTFHVLNSSMRGANVLADRTPFEGDFRDIITIPDANVSRTEKPTFVFDKD